MDEVARLLYPEDPWRPILRARFDRFMATLSDIADVLRELPDAEFEPPSEDQVLAKVEFLLAHCEITLPGIENHEASRADDDADEELPIFH